MKKVLLVIIFLLLVAIGYVFLTNKSDVSAVDQSVDIAKKEVKESAKVKSEMIADKATSDNVIKLDKVMEDEDIIIDKKWMSHIRTIFEEGLLDDSDAYDDYQSMKSSFEEERLEAYDDFMDQVKKENKGFNITELEDGRYKEVEEEYLKAFQKRYGQKVFLKYLEAIEKHNEENPSYQIYF
jgi:hypothetical protein